MTLSELSCTGEKTESALGQWHVPGSQGEGAQSRDENLDIYDPAARALSQ